MLITVDRNLPFQQNISSLQIAVLILTATGITYGDLKPLVPEILIKLSELQPGEIHRIGT